MRHPVAAVHADAVRVLDASQPPDEPQRALREAFLGFVAARPDACARTCVPGHLTASARIEPEPLQRDSPGNGTPIPSPDPDSAPRCRGRAANMTS